MRTGSFVYSFVRSFVLSSVRSLVGELRCSSHEPALRHVPVALLCNFGKITRCFGISILTTTTSIFMRERTSPVRSLVRSLARSISLTNVLTNALESLLLLGEIDGYDECKCFRRPFMPWQNSY